MSTLGRSFRSLVKSQAPHFSGVAWWNSFRNISIQDYRSKYFVLFFYPLNFTFVCPTEIIEFSNRAKDFRSINCDLIGCSVDSQYSHMQYAQQPRDQGGLGGVDFYLLSDITKKISRDYGVLIEEGPDAGVALRGTFIVDGEGIVRYSGVNDLPVGRNVDEVYRLVQGFQFSDRHGEVCPSSWRPGSDTLQTDPDSSKTKDYWKNIHANK